MNDGRLNSGPSGHFWITFSVKCKCRNFSCTSKDLSYDLLSFECPFGRWCLLRCSGYFAVRIEIAICKKCETSFPRWRANESMHASCGHFASMANGLIVTTDHNVLLSRTLNLTSPYDEYVYCLSREIPLKGITPDNKNSQVTSAANHSEQSLPILSVWVH